MKRLPMALVLLLVNPALASGPHYEVLAVHPDNYDFSVDGNNLRHLTVKVNGHVRDFPLRTYQVGACEDERGWQYQCYAVQMDLQRPYTYVILGMPERALRRGRFLQMTDGDHRISFRVDYVNSPGLGTMTPDEPK